ncbi:hypothetical protein GCM10028813_05680 [Ramlibacter alkalitolerans]
MPRRQLAVVAAPRRIEQSLVPHLGLPQLILVPKLGSPQRRIMADPRVAQGELVPRAGVAGIQVVPVFVTAQLPGGDTCFAQLDEPGRAGDEAIAVVHMALARHGGAGDADAGEQDGKNLGHGILPSQSWVARIACATVSGWHTRQPADVGKTLLRRAARLTRRLVRHGAIEVSLRSAAPP